MRACACVHPVNIARGFAWATCCGRYRPVLYCARCPLLSCARCMRVRPLSPPAVASQCTCVWACTCVRTHTFAHGGVRVRSAVKPYTLNQVRESDVLYTLIAGLLQVCFLLRSRSLSLPAPFSASPARSCVCLSVPLCNGLYLPAQRTKEQMATSQFCLSVTPPTKHAQVCPLLCLSACQPVSLSACLPVCLSACLPLCVRQFPPPSL